MSKLIFSATYSDTEDTISVLAQSYDGEFYKCTLDNFTSSQKPRQDFIKERCIDYIIENISETIYIPSIEITIPCTVHLSDKVYIEFTIHKQAEEVKNKNLEKIIEIIKLPTQFDCADLGANLNIRKYVVAASKSERYINDEHQFHSTSNYEIKDIGTYSPAPTLDDVRIECLWSGKIIHGSTPHVSDKYGVYRYNPDDYTAVFDTRDPDGLFSTESKASDNSNLSLNPKVALLIRMVTFGWRLVNIDLYKYYHTLNITVYETGNNGIIKFSVNETHKINSIDDLYSNNLLWVDSGNSTYIPQRDININMKFRFSNHTI